MRDISNKPDNVLIVDDDPILTIITESYFRKIGSSVIRTAGNGREALEIFDSDPNGIDFILCDLNMPELDGVECLRHLRDRCFAGRIAILSGEHGSVLKSAGGLAVAHDLDIVEILGKPLSIKELDKAVSKAPILKIAPAQPGIAVEVSPEDLRVALQCGHIQPFFQPKVDVRTKKVVGAEALARWMHPGFGVLAPYLFIPIAEQNGMISDLTDTMIEQTLSAIVKWKTWGFSVKVSVNLTAEALSDLGFPNRLAALTESAGVAKNSLVLEVTESSLLQNSHASVETLTRLRIMGYDVSIDDFGTGYSNIEQLRQFPFSELKIDRSFISEATTDSFARACVETSINLGRKLDMRLVAEGVETQEGWDFVAESGIDEVQGFYIAKPMSADDFSNWLLNYDTQHQRTPARTAR